MNDIGVVVINYNKYELTQNCVDKLIGINAPVQVLIVDNDSLNDSYNVLRNKYENVENIDVIRNSENAGYAKGNNFGIRYLLQKNDSLKYFCIMNPDVEITYPKIFDNLKGILDGHPQIAMITGKMITNGDLDINKSYWDFPKKREAALGHSLIYKRKKGSIHYLENDIGEVEAVTGSFFMVKRSVFEKLNGFDEGTFLYNEENIMGIRINKLGLTCGLSINDFFNHNHPRNPRQKLSQKIKSRKYGNQSRRYMCKTYYTKVDSVLLELIILFNYCYIVVTHPIGKLFKLIKKGK